MAGPPIEQVLERHADALMARPGVVGVGLGEADGAPVILVMCEVLTPEHKAALPTELEGHRVVLEETGAVEAFEAG